MSNQIDTISDMKYFGASLAQVVNALPGQLPLLEIPLHQSVLNMIGTALDSLNLAYLGCACGELLRRLNNDPSRRHMIRDKARELSLLEKSAEYFTRLNVSLVILVPTSLSINAEEASRLLTTYFLEMNIYEQIMAESN